MEKEIIHRSQNFVLYEVVNMFISSVKLDILTVQSVGIDLLLEPASGFCHLSQKFEKMMQNEQLSLQRIRMFLVYSACSCFY